MDTITITWRDEDYGDLSGCAAAFRIYQPIPCDAYREMVHNVIQQAGFGWDGDRAAWYTYDKAAPHAMITALEKYGIEVSHAGRWPEGPPCA